MDPANIAPLTRYRDIQVNRHGDPTAQQFRDAHSPCGDKTGFVKQQ